MRHDRKNQATRETGEKYYVLPLEEIERILKTSAGGLDPAEAKKRVEEFGANEIIARKKKTIAGILAAQLTDFMILILVAASVVSGLIGDVTDTIVILAIVVINAVVGVIQEWKAEKAMEALQTMAASKARVIRGNASSEVAASELVPGDRVVLEAGNIVPADIRLAETHSLKVDESSLTGESVNVEKSADPLPEGEYPLGDRINIAYKGSVVTYGRGAGYVVATGMSTELGHIAEMIQTGEGKTPLQKRLANFGKQLTVIILILCAVFFFIGWRRGEDWSSMLLTSISLAVAAIPEALPALVTVALALGAERLVKSNALIRKLPAVETLGSVTYICSDKTGTLTLNKMTVKELYVTDLKDGAEMFGGKDVLLHCMALNNDVTRDRDGNWVGDSTEVALVRFAADKGFDRVDLEKKYRRVMELPFDSKRKCMTTVHETERGVIVVVKGAADVLYQKLVPEQRTLLPEFETSLSAMARKGYRMLAYAIRTMDRLPDKRATDDIESSLWFVGFAGMIDPPRDEAKKAVDECKNAGIIPVMITGDHIETAKAIARDLGILSAEKDRALPGPELEKMSDEEFDRIVTDVKVYARVSPEQKLRIIRALQGKKQFVAMTGDGVNDAPALKNADIGVAMGINGTQVAKEAAHMILLDDNFATIVVAVRHGRRIFDNILKFIKYIMTGNSGEIWALFVAPFLGLPIPLLAIHILWVNLVSDGLPGLALASERSEPDLMLRRPRDPQRNIFAGGPGFHIIFFGAFIGMVTIGTQAWALHNGYDSWQTMTFTVLCFSQLAHVMAIRSTERSTFAIGFFSNPWMIVALAVTFGLQLMIIYVPFFNDVFRTRPLSVAELLIVVAVSSLVFWMVEFVKFLKRKKLISVA